MLTRTPYKDKGDMDRGAVTFRAKLTTTTNGTLSTTTGACRSSHGLTVVKTAAETGRYTFTLDGAFIELGSPRITVEGAADAAYTNGKGALGILRGVSTTTGVFYIQMVRPDSMADAEVDDGAIIRVAFDVLLAPTS